MRPLEQPKGNPLTLTREAPSVSNPGVAATPDLGPTDYAWVIVRRARNALETALERLATEIRRSGVAGQPAFARNGTTFALSASSGAASLLGTADCQSLRLMIVGGDGWTFVMHPLMGVATLDEDPASFE